MRLKVIAALFLALFLLACIQQNQNNEIKIYYYFSPRCPNCREVEPLINFLKNESSIKFYICNVDNFQNCSKESREIAYKTKEKLGFFGTPIAVVKENGKTKLFVGKYQILNMVKYLANSTELPEIRFNKSNFSVRDCIECHEERNISPPPQFSCNYCCHNIG